MMQIKGLVASSTNDINTNVLLMIISHKYKTVQSQLCITYHNTKLHVQLGGIVLRKMKGDKSI